MKLRMVGWLSLATLIALPVLSEDLVVRLDDGGELVRLDVPQGAGWCVLWNHSVELFQVSDCYENHHGKMVLIKSHFPDFAAGLDHIPGRGTQISDGQGGYWIMGINEPVPGNSYVLRIGSLKVNHRLRTLSDEISISQLAPRTRVTISLDEGG